MPGRSARPAWPVRRIIGLLTATMATAALLTKYLTNVIYTSDYDDRRDARTAI